MSQPGNRPRGLGRGLSALMSDVGASQEEDRRGARRPDTLLPIEVIEANPDQPRRQFDEANLGELANSIREKGVIQPIIVRPSPGNGERYQIVAGERRWRAAQMAQLHDMPVLIRDYSDTEMLEVAIIENIQRADLNPVDEAAGYRQLIERFGHTQEQLAQALGKSRSHIANLMRLLGLPDEVRSMLSAGTLTAGHARALIGHPEAVELARRVVGGGLSVRDTEELARKAPAARRPRASRKTAEKDADTRQIEGDLAATLGMGVSIDQDPGAESGRLTLRYSSLAQLDDLLRVLSGG